MCGAPAVRPAQGEGDAVGQRGAGCMSPSDGHRHPGQEVLAVGSELAGGHRGSQPLCGCGGAESRAAAPWEALGSGSMARPMSTGRGGCPRAPGPCGEPCGALPGWPCPMGPAPGPAPGFAVLRRRLEAAPAPAPSPRPERGLSPGAAGCRGAAQQTRRACPAVLPAVLTAAVPSEAARLQRDARRSPSCWR